MVIDMTRPRRKKKVVEPVGDTIDPSLAILKKVELTAEVDPVGDEVRTAPTPKPTKQEQIDKLLKEHPPFLGTPTMRYYGETLYPWLHELEQLLETA